MRIAVVTPYYDESEEILRICHDSVCRQSYPATHIMVADGRPQAWVGASTAQHLVLPVSHDDCGDTPRGLGALSAIAQGFDAVAFLDADNWYQPVHLETVVRLQQDSGAAICSTRRSMHRTDGSLMGYCYASDGDDFVDTNCLAVFRDAFHILPQWILMPPWAHAVGDRMMWHLLRDSGLKTAHVETATVCYRSSYRFHYEKLGETPPADAVSTERIAGAVARWRAEGLPPFKGVAQIKVPE